MTSQSSQVQLTKVLKEGQTKVKFNFLEICPINLAMQSVLGENFKNQLYENHKKQLPKQIILLQICYQSEQWILLKTSYQCKELIYNLSQTLFQQSKIDRKFEAYLQAFKSFLPNQKAKFDEMNIEILEGLNYIGRVKQILENQLFQKFIQWKNPYERYTYRKFKMIKKSGGRHRDDCCKLGIFTQWKKRQVNIQYNGVTYKNQSGQMKQYLPFSHGFEYFYGKALTQRKLGIVLISNHRRLVLQAQNYEDFIMFLYILKKKVTESPYLSINRFQSFAPVRQQTESKFYIDGENYFGDLAQAISKAERFIYITGWMISPEFLMIRGENLVSLQDLIRQRANKGVQVNILVYRESSFLTNDSLHVKQKFESIGPNVKVLRHPNNKLPVLWSHHSKMVIIDKEHAFFGGLDLCYGRYDSNKHELFPENIDTLYPGIQYNNCRLKDIDNVRQYTLPSINQKLPRLPWHDICQSVKGDIVDDFVHHFVEVWNFASFQNRKVLNKTLLSSPTEPEKKKMTEKLIKLTKQSQDGQVEHEKQKKNKDSPNKVFTTLLNDTVNQIRNKGKNGIDRIRSRILNEETVELEKIYRKNQNPKSHYFQKYMQDVKQQITQLEEGSNPFLDPYNQISNGQKKGPRIPLKLVQNDLNTQAQKQKQNRYPQIIVIPKPPELRKRLTKKNSLLMLEHKAINMQSVSSIHQEKQADQNYINCLKNMDIREEFVKVNTETKDRDIDSEEEGPAKIWENSPQSRFKYNGSTQCQLLRSVGNWSIGCSKENTQFSIHIAYLQVIFQAKHFIYIENQFFISSTYETPELKNKICDALFSRIKSAVDRRETFRVFVMMPLLPAFAGDLQNDQCAFLRMLIEFQYKTIKGLLNRIEQQLKVDPFNYIKFMGLRTHGRNKLNENKPSTEIIYVHSKLMIIDDLTVICGSANINDRSMLGQRDSEIAVLSNGTDLVPSILNGKETMISKSIRKLRIKLWSEHFHINKDKLQDPTSHSLWKMISDISQNNAQIYRQLFGCYPDNQMKTIEAIKNRKVQQVDQRQYERLSKQIIGNVVQYPFNFLADQPAPANLMNKEYYIPTQCII